MNLSLLPGAPAAIRRRLRVSLLTVASVAVLAAFANGFLVISLQGAVGAVERVGDPFRRWLVISSLMVPVYGLAVLGAVALVRRWLAGTRHRGLLYTAALTAMILAVTLVGVAALAASAAYDYRLQSARIEAAAARLAALPPSPGDGTSLFCDTSGPAPGVSPVGLCLTCEQQRRTLETHVRGGALASLLALVANTVLVLWAVALRGGRLWSEAEPSVPAGSGPAGDPALAVT